MIVVKIKLMSTKLSFKLYKYLIKKEYFNTVFNGTLNYFKVII